MSNDRFNHNVDRKVKTKAAPVRRVEVITGVERRRDWPDEKKLAIVAESCQDGVVISDVARRHGLRPQQLFAWRSEFRKREAAGRLFGGMSGGTQGGTQAFAPVMIANERPAVAAAETPAMAAYPLPASQLRRSRRSRCEGWKLASRKRVALLRSKSCLAAPRSACMAALTPRRWRRCWVP